MVKGKKLLTTAAIAAGLIGSGVGSTVLAVTTTAGGGHWEYGWSATGGHSNYLHNSKTHSASVGPSKSNCVKVKKPKKDWARAFYKKFPPTDLQYYWNVY